MRVTSGFVERTQKFMEGRDVCKRCAIDEIHTKVDIIHNKVDIIHTRESIAPARDIFSRGGGAISANLRDQGIASNTVFCVLIGI